MIVVRTHTLSNGCRVLLRPTPNKPILSITAGWRWGGRDDEPEQAGRSNLMARLLVKGTESRSAVQVAETLESVGGEIDPFCDHDMMGIDVQVAEPDWRIAVELLSDCLFASNFDPQEFEKERAMAQAAVRRSEDNKFAFTYKKFQQLFYDGHPYGTHPGGEIETLAGLDRDEVATLYPRIARPENLTLVAVGNVPEEAFLAELEKRIPKGSDTPPAKRRDASVQAGAGRGRTETIERQVEQGFVVVGYLAPDVGEAESVALRLACGVLGEGMSARLFSRLRDRDHLAYAVGASLAPRMAASHLIGFIGTRAETIDPACEGLRREAEGLVNEAPTPEEIDRARRYILGKYLISRQTNSALAHSMLWAEMAGLGWQWPEEFPQRLKAVTPELMLEAAREYLQNPAIAILRPVGLGD